MPRLRESPLLQGEMAAPERLVSHYYDTVDRALRTAGYVLRVRQSSDGIVQTVKQGETAAAGLFVRPEWERPIDGDRPVIVRGDGMVGDLVEPDDLTRVFTTDVTRDVRNLTMGDAQIEVALDEGVIRAGRARRALCEVELELKGGSPAPVFAFARELNALVPLRLGVRSKGERGYALADREESKAVKAEPIILDRALSACEGFAVIANACIRHFRRNEPRVLQQGDGESLHQARVAVRRLRSAFSSFKPLMEADARAKVLNEDLRWLAGQLGEVRDLDVLIPKIEGSDRARLVQARRKALGEARIALNSLRARQLMIDLAEWLAIGTWRSDPADPGLARESIVILAADLLDRHRRRLKRRGGHLAKLSDRDRHKARIEAKKLRYASEFFACLWSSEAAQARHADFLDALEKLQDNLGTLNDQSVAAVLLERHNIPAPDDGRDRRKLLKKAEKNYDALMEVRPFWR
jgi:inorganic triphosphatase YgiF